MVGVAVNTIVPPVQMDVLLALIVTEGTIVELTVTVNEQVVVGELLKA